MTRMCTKGCGHETPHKRTVYGGRQNWVCWGCQNGEDNCVCEVQA